MVASGRVALLRILAKRADERGTGASLDAADPLDSAPTELAIATTC
jgi:hypothetical protein